MRRKGFTLIELLVVIAIIALLVTLLLPKLQQARDLAKKAACMANLNGIGKAIALYQESFRGHTPRINKTYDAPEDPIDDTGPTDTTFGETEDWVSFGENAMQNVWLILKEGLIGSNGFACPADGDWVDRADSVPGGGLPEKYGWYTVENFSYGMQSPYDFHGAGVVNPAAFTDDLDGLVVIFADKNPGGPVIRDDRKPSNHAKLGTAYLIASGSAGFHETRDNSVCGKDGDDIYSSQNADGTNPPDTQGNVPETEDDTYICLP